MSKTPKIFAIFFATMLTFAIPVKPVHGSITNIVHVQVESIMFESSTIIEDTPESIDFPTQPSSIEAQLENLENLTTCPSRGSISSTFGGRTSPGGIGSTNHQGIDIAASYGTPVYVYKEGVVVQAGFNGGYGYSVEVQHDDFNTFYAHMPYVSVAVGEYVMSGDQIGVVASTGNSTGPHLHLELHIENSSGSVAVDPSRLLEAC
jgi:murein DD-endopeptidase MepM/ murein hydrolase activator NlpD